MSVKKLLLVEDDDDVAIRITRLLRRLLPGVQIIWVVNQHQARRMFDKHCADLDLIMMDGEVPGGETNTTVALIRAIRESDFSREIIGISGNESLKQPMLSAGCNYWVWKPDMVEQLHDLLRMTGGLG